MRQVCQDDALGAAVLDAHAQGSLIYAYANAFRLTVSRRRMSNRTEYAYGGLLNVKQLAATRLVTKYPE